MNIQIPARSDRLHRGQLRIIEAAKRFNVVICGRRFGKSILGEQIAVEGALAGYPIGWFAPNYRLLDEPMRDIASMLLPVTTQFNKQDKRLFLATGGCIDFWSCDSDEPGRSRAYKTVILDEAAFIANLKQLWDGPIRPTLTEHGGSAWFLSTPYGHNDAMELFARGESGVDGWASFRAKTIDNPYISKDEVENARRELPPDVFAQEYEGIPAANAGNPFGVEALAAIEGSCEGAGKVVAWGVDLAKSQDWTVACGLDSSGRVSELHRWQADWASTEDRLVALLGGVPAMVDSTGVGDPVVERLVAKLGASVQGFKFTAPSKQDLMRGLVAAVQAKEIRVPPCWLMNELRSFRYEYTATGVRYAAPSGMNDDGVCALALAVKRRGSASADTGFRFRVIDYANNF
jgi:hypothetical protein